jgi:hypothetical protein
VNTRHQVSLTETSRWLVTLAVVLGIVFAGLGLLSAQVTQDEILSQGQTNSGQTNSGLANSGESILVRRDLSVLTPFVVSEIGPDGVVMETGALVPWYDVLVAQNWQRTTNNQLVTVPNTEILEYQQTYGQPWFLVRSRLARGEKLEVARLLTELARRDADRAPATTNSIAARYLLAGQLAQSGDTPQAWIEWLTARQSAEKKFSGADSSHNDSNWLDLFLNRTDYLVDPIVHLPLAIPFPSSWSDEQQQQLLALSDRPGAALCWVAARLSDSRPSDRKVLAETLKQCFANANSDQRELLTSCLDTIEKIERWRADIQLLTSDEVRYGYLEIESQWTTLRHRMSEPEVKGTKQDQAELKRQKLVWQLRLEGLFLTAQSDPRIAEAGLLRLLLLEHWGFKNDRHR